MTTRVLNCSVDIGGVDFSSYVRSITREHYICRPVGTAIISVDPDNAPACTPSSVVSISEMGTQRFTGYVSDISKGHVEATYEIECQDELKKLAEYNFVDEAIVANGETITYWIDYFLGRVGITSRVVAETVDTVPPGIEFHLESCMEIVKKLCNTQGWQIYADASGTVHVGDFLIPGPAVSISNPTRVVDSSDDSWLRNNVTVFGYGGIKGEITTIIPELHDETRSAVLANPYIRTQEQAQAIASQMAGYFDTPLDTKEIAMEGGERASFLLENVAAGDPYVLGISGQVTGLETSFVPDGYIQTHYLNERCPGFWALGSGPPTGGSCFIGHKSAGVYRYDYRNDVAVTKNTGLAGTALQCHDLKVDPHFYGEGRRRVWRVTAGGVYKSYNDAESWQAVSFPDPVNTSGDSPAPTVADLTFYGMAFDKVLRGVTYVLAGYITPTDRLWIYKTEDYGNTWTSAALHFHSYVGTGGWTKHWAATLGELVYFFATECLYMSSCSVVDTIYFTKVYEYNGLGGAPIEVLDVAEPPVGIYTWPSEDIIGMAATDDGRLYVVSHHMRSPRPPAIDKVVVHVTTDGHNWTKIMDTNTGLGLGVTWERTRSFGVTHDGFDLLVSITHAENGPFNPPFHSYVIGCRGGTTWFQDLVGDDVPGDPDYFFAFGKLAPDWYPTLELAMCRDSNNVTYWRLDAQWWEIHGTANIPWGLGGCFYSTPYEDGIMAANYDTSDLYHSRDGVDWSLVDDAKNHSGMGMFEDRLFTGTYDEVYIQTMPGYFQTDYSAPIGGGFRTPFRFVEAWDTLWCVTRKGLWYRNDGAPSWAMNMRRSAMANQGHQYSVETLPNIPWVVYVGTARESDGDEYIRLLRVHAANFGSAMSHSFSSGSVTGRPGFIRVSAPPRSGSCVDEIVYAFGRGYETPGDPLSNELVWRFESGQAPADKTDAGWPGYKFDAIQSLLHNGDDQDWVALFNSGAARGTTDGGDNWNDLTDVTILTDGADRVGNEIVAGRYSSGSIMIRYSADRALAWNSQGDGISTADGVASVQMYDKTRLR